MPYKGEFSNKIMHERLIKNPEFQKRLKELRVAYDTPNRDITSEIRQMFRIIDTEDASKNVKIVFAVDGSYTDIPINNNIPSARIGIANFCASVVKLDELKKSAQYEFLDPHEFNDTYTTGLLTFVGPLANIIEEGKTTTSQSIRYAIYKFMCNKPFDETLPLINTLYTILKEGNDKTVESFNCPNPECNEHIEWDLEKDNINPKKCPGCGEEVYLTDWLRLHEAVEEDFESTSILSRLTQVVEHLLVFNLIQTCLSNQTLVSLPFSMAFILDRPLAIYGEPAKLHRYILKYYHKLMQNKNTPLIIFGLAKSGRLKDHFELLERRMKEIGEEIPKNAVMLVSDAYRFKYIQQRPKRNEYFGQEISWGQDFLFYSKEAKKFVVSLPYSVDEKKKEYYEKMIFNIDSYSTLPTVLDLINKITTDLYEDAILPVALAHRYASISLKPSKQILEMFARELIK